MTDHKQIDRIGILLDSGFNAIVQGRDVKERLKTLERKIKWQRAAISR